MNLPPILNKKSDLGKTTKQLVSIRSKTSRDVHNTNFEIIFIQLEKSLK